LIYRGIVGSYRQQKAEIYEQIARVGKAVSSGPRLEILDLLGQGPRSVDGIAEEVGQSVANTSHHLQVLRRASLVRADKDGVRVRYRLADDDVGGFLRTLRLLAESRLLELGQAARALMEPHGTTESVDVSGLAERVRQGSVVLLDVRPGDEFWAGHMPGAISVPLADLESRLGELPQDREIVAYCRGPYCVMAMKAVALLAERGFSAAHLDEGVVDWRARGQAVACPEV
jgi:rhodanese-related sulfurtransferase/DNA-binding transcriptional ArsR family regulator